VIFIAGFSTASAPRPFSLFVRLGGAGQFLSRSRYPWTPIFFVLVAAAIVATPSICAFRDPSQFKNLAVAILHFSLRPPAYFFWSKRPLLEFSFCSGEALAPRLGSHLLRSAGVEGDLHVLSKSLFGMGWLEFQNHTARLATCSLRPIGLKFQIDVQILHLRAILVPARVNIANTR